MLPVTFKNALDACNIFRLEDPFTSPSVVGPVNCPVWTEIEPPLNPLRAVRELLPPWPLFIMLFKAEAGIVTLTPTGDSVPNIPVFSTFKVPSLT
jgi:hypothetical protein